MAAKKKNIKSSGGQVKKSPKSVDIKENKYFNYALLALFAIFIILFTTFKISGDDDVFWHLATGRHIIETGSVPSQDIFGFTTEGQEWMPFEWGWDVITYGLYQIGGYDAISVLRTIIFLLIFGITYFILKRFKVSFNISLLIMGLMAFGIIDRLTPRPHIMSFLFFMLLLLIITDYKYFRHNYKVLYFIPLIFLLWANIHMGIIAGMFLLGIFVVSEIINYNKKLKSEDYKVSTKPELMRLLLIVLASFLVMFINPNSFQTYIYAYDHTQMKMLETINEWRSPFDEMYSGSFVTIIYKIFLFSGLLVLYYAFKKKDWFIGLLVVGFAFYSVRAVRFTVDYIIITAVFLALSIDYILSLMKSRGFKEQVLKGPVLKVLYGVFLIYCVFRLPSDKLYFENLRYYRIYGLGVDNDFIPVDMFEFMKEHNIPARGGNVFNHFGTGGFFVWNFPGEKNFIDSRNLNDETYDLYNFVLTKSPGFEQKLNDYNIDYAVYLSPDLVRIPQEMQNSIVSYFVNNDEWKLVFWDDKSFLFVKNKPEYQEIIEKYNYKYLDPYSFFYDGKRLQEGISGDKVQFEKEYRRKLSEEPNGLIINNVKVNYEKMLNQ